MQGIPSDTDKHLRSIESWPESPKRRDRKVVYPLHQSVHWKHLGCVTRRVIHERQMANALSRADRWVD